jgi:hypothetical protein
MLADTLRERVGKGEDGLEAAERAAMAERHEGEHELGRFKLLDAVRVVRKAESNRKGEVVASLDAGEIAAEHVTRELVEENDERNSAREALGFPVREGTGLSREEEVTEAIGDVSINALDLTLAWKPQALLQIVDAPAQPVMQDLCLLRARLLPQMQPRPSPIRHPNRRRNPMFTNSAPKDKVVMML